METAIKCAFWKVVLSSGPLGQRWSVSVLQGHLPSPDQLLQAGLPVSCTICSGDKVHLRLFTSSGSSFLPAVLARLAVLREFRETHYWLSPGEFPGPWEPG